MEERCENALKTDAMELEGWKGYEFWSAQLEVREESAEYHCVTGQIFRVDGSSDRVRADRDNVYPF